MTRPIDVRNLTMRYGDINALDNVSIRVEMGELLAILGPSGCGKSTLLNIISGLQKATNGEIFIGDRQVDHLPPQKRGIGFLFQNYALFPNMTVAENIAFGLRIRGTDRVQTQKRVAELLDIVNLTEHAGKSPRQISGGQQQRVALARALAPKPDILLLDEPLSALDVKIRQRLREEIKNLQKNLGITTILVTHDQEEAFEMGDRVAVMENGVIAQVGEPEQIYESPENEFVACFVGNINQLSGVVHAGRAWACSMAVDLAEGHGFADNTPVKILVRPENFIIDKEVPEAAVRDAARGTITKTVFLGAMMRLDILQDNGQSIAALVGKEHLRKEHLHPGQRVTIRAKHSQVIVSTHHKLCGEI